MPEAGTLEEAFAMADEQLNNTEDETVEETVDEPEEVEEPETEASEEDKSKAEADAFTKVNPDELPEELKGTYKSLQADYTRKTQEAAKTRKESEARVKELEDKLAELEKSSRPPEKPLTEEERIKEAVKGELESEKIASFRDKALSDYESADERLVLDSETYDKPTDLFVGQEMDERLANHVKEGNPEYTFDYKTALEEVLAEWDGYVQKKQKAYLEAQTKKAKDKTKNLQKQNPQGRSGVGRPKKVDLDEAIGLAFQEA